MIKGLLQLDEIYAEAIIEAGVVKRHWVTYLQEQRHNKRINKSYYKVKTLLQEREKMITYLEKWQEQLKIDGVNSKGMVANDIQYLLKEIKK